MQTNQNHYPHYNKWGWIFSWFNRVLLNYIVGLITFKYLKLSLFCKTKTIPLYLKSGILKRNNYNKELYYLWLVKFCRQHVKQVVLMLCETFLSQGSLLFDARVLMEWISHLHDLFPLLFNQIFDLKHVHFWKRILMNRFLARFEFLFISNSNIIRFVLIKIQSYGFQNQTRSR